MIKTITDKVTWVGKIDWELTRFHGDEYSTKRGSSYNSYLIRDTKTVLIDTVWLPYDKEFVNRLKQVVDLHSIDYIVMNHNEIDHSGALPELMREIPDVPIYCTARGEAILRGHYHQDWNFVTVKTGDKLNIGKSTLTFIEAAMIHWPDTMFTYMDDEQILFSNDGFGQHYATESLYNDTVNESDLIWEAEKYYANILNPFSKLVAKKIQEIKDMNLPIRMICPSHGVIWRNNPAQIIERYAKWADKYQEDQITLLYDTMWQSTRLMAQAIAEGIRQMSPSTIVKLFNITRTDKTDLITEVFQSKAILVGSPTVNGGVTYATSGILELIHGSKMCGKKAAAFGSYGWNCGAVQMITDSLRHSGFTIINDGIKMPWIPDNEALDVCVQFGRDFAESING